MIFLDKIPLFAIVDEGVTLTGKYAGKQAKNFVNAILRKAVTIKDDKDQYLNELSVKEYLSVKYSFNMNVINQLYKKNGKEKLESILDSLQHYNKTSISINTLKTTKKDLIPLLEDEGFSVVESSLPNGLFISGHQNPSHSRLYQDGYFSLMDMGAMKVVEALSIKKGENILEASASPGGKTIYMAQQLENTGSITACDIHASRVRIMSENTKRMGAQNVVCDEKDMSEYHNQFLEKYDKVLLDVPCSGLGVSKKRPEIKLKYEYSEQLIDTQKKILSNCSKYVKTTGQLLYVTCTILPCENELIIKWFLENHQFKTIKMENILPSENNMGFFYCLMEKIND
jgi:16S rRNA (cytosine967-C5)-methyltransferase